MTELEPRLSEADAQKVIARAAELQAERAGTLSMAQLREIAAELSIPESAVDQALLEFRGGGSPNQQAPALPVAAAPGDHRRDRNPLVLAMAFVGTALALLIVASMAIRLFP